MEVEYLLDDNDRDTVADLTWGDYTPLTLVIGKHHDASYVVTAEPALTRDPEPFFEAEEDIARVEAAWTVEGVSPADDATRTWLAELIAHTRAALADPEAGFNEDHAAQCDEFVTWLNTRPEVDVAEGEEEQYGEPYDAAAAIALTSAQSLLRAEHPHDVMTFWSLNTWFSLFGIHDVAPDLHVRWS